MRESSGKAKHERQRTTREMQHTPTRDLADEPFLRAVCIVVCSLYKLHVDAHELVAKHNESQSYGE